jgi:RNA polymerase sigma-54 factor
MLKQFLSQKLQQKLSPQQIQLMKLLQVPTAELEQRIKQEIEENPALEEGEEAEEDAEVFESEEKETSEQLEEFDFSDYFDDDTPDYKLSAQNYSADDEERSMPLSVGATFQDMLLTQIGLRNLDEQTRMLAEHIVGNLDESGYLRRDIDSIINDLAFSQNLLVEKKDLLTALEVVQSLDPAGVGAQDLRQCLLLQLERKVHPDASTKTAYVILDKLFESFTKKHYSKIMERLDLEEEHLKDAIDEITSLNPRPGNTARDSSRTAQEIVPDFVVNVVDGQLELLLNSRNAPELKVSRTYRNMAQEYNKTAKGKKSKDQKEALMFIKQKLDSAKWFIDAIKQRQHTLMTTMNAIMEHQKEYFLTGDETKMKPMILKDIAEVVSLDISTVSRVANSKYVQTPYGTLSLKFFFSESLSTDSGEEVSTREVKKILQEAIDAENKRKPLTDEALMTLLKEKGYQIARRTVAKYREQLNIPVARLRKEL